MEMWNALTECAGVILTELNVRLIELAEVAGTAVQQVVDILLK